MPRRPTATPYRPMAPTAPRRRALGGGASAAGLHPLTDRQANGTLQAYD